MKPWAKAKLTHPLVACFKKQLAADADTVFTGTRCKPEPNVKNLLSAEQVLGMSPDDNPLAALFTTQQERMIYEYTPAGQSVPMVPHLNFADTTPRHLRLEWLQRQLGCSWEDAGRVQVALKMLQASPQVATWFVKSFKLRTEAAETPVHTAHAAEKAIAWLEKLAQDLDVVTGGDDLLEEVPSEATWQGEWSRVHSHGPDTAWHHGYEVMAEQLSYLSDSVPWHHYGQEDALSHYPKMVHDPSELRFDTEYEAELVDVFIARHGLAVEDEEQVIAATVEAAHDSGDPDGYSRQDLYRYHRTGMKERDWLHSQPITFRRIIDNLRHASELEAKSLAKAVYAAEAGEYYRRAAEEGLRGNAIRCLKAVNAGRVELYRRAFRNTGFVTDEIRVDGGWMTVCGEQFKPTKRWELNSELKRSFYLNDNDLEKVLHFSLTHTPPLTRNQSRYFWAVYNSRKKSWDVALNAQAQAVAKRIREAKSAKHLSWIGKQMFDFQSGNLGACQITGPEWTKLWATYYSAKRQWSAKAA